ncbi:hypothetical protein BRADI_1g11860v3 [Brachypodium distachyon]|uniref:Leucine-rich repeat-containing N-terminal plant-type domain-containing protein n=1 Tax=Brachypodium distachyon TaxID=15368 RepID=I1GPD2_BRADI|nr:hypothetical protein BRADI_1g11860v3 [Brachypodium distachyon]
MSIAVILLVVMLGVSRPAGAATDPKDVVAMQALAKSTGAATSLGWGVKSADPCDGTWVGVRCNNDDLSHVTSIVASRAGLDGSLPGNELSMLEFLTELDLSFNKLGDELPTVPIPLKHLTALDLRANSFSKMPDFFFRGFPALETVVLDDNAVVMGDMTEAPACPGLRSFSANNFTIYGELPIYFGNKTLFPALESLSVARNQLTFGVSPYFGKDSGIKFLDISGQIDDGVGKLSGRLDFVSGMTSLVEIRVAGNGFYGPLPDVSGLVNLKVFDAADNKLCGPVKFPPAVAVNVAGNPKVGNSCP